MGGTAAGVFSQSSVFELVVADATLGRVIAQLLTRPGMIDRRNARCSSGVEKIVRI